MKVVMLAVAMITLVTLGPGWAAAQQMAPHDDTMMMHGKTLAGVVTRVRFVSCGNTPQTCQGIFEITPAESGAMQPSDAGHMMMQHPVTVIVIPGALLIWQNAPLPLTGLHTGDLVKLEYTELNDMNVVTQLTMTGMAGPHM
ncbi:MAG TPA: hypothetical protein VEW91_09440 [bacterium]|nr:hypothetical protein [bacterium]